jgi:hypothetical protein
MALVANITAINIFSCILHVVAMLMRGSLPALIAHQFVVGEFLNVGACWNIA